MTRFFSNGLYIEPFYTRHQIDSYTPGIWEDIEYNSELLAEHYKNDLDFEYVDEEDQYEQISQMFWENLGYWPVYFEPLIFNEEVALECGLTPFTYKDIPMLALSGCGMDLSPRLEAYQALTHNTIDAKSKLFDCEGELNTEYFRSVAGDAVTEKILEVIAM